MHNGNSATGGKDLKAQGFGFPEKTQSGGKKSAAVEVLSNALHMDMPNHLSQESAEIKLQLMDRIPFVPVSVDEEGPFLFVLYTGEAGNWQRISPGVDQTLHVEPDSPRNATIGIGELQLKNLPV